jgi:predicted secreted protein
MKVLILLILTIIILSQNNEYRKVKLQDVTEDSYVPLKIGQKVIIEVEGNPTTGYIWILSNPNHLKKVKPLNLDEKNSTEYYSTNTTIGAGGIYHFKFKAEEVGNDVLIFKYKRPWETESTDTKSVNLIVVHPDL